MLMRLADCEKDLDAALVSACHTPPEMAGEYDNTYLPGCSSAAGYRPIKKPLTDARPLDSEGLASSMRAA